MKRLRKLAGILCVCLLLGGCGQKVPEKNQPENDTLVVGTLNFDGKFSPFFYTNAYENDIMQLVHLYLLNTDREGDVVLQGIAGKLEYDYIMGMNCTRITIARKEVSAV